MSVLKPISYRSDKMYSLPESVTPSMNASRMALVKESSDGWQ